MAIVKNVFIRIFSISHAARMTAVVEMLAGERDDLKCRLAVVAMLAGHLAKLILIWPRSGGELQCAFPLPSFPLPKSLLTRYRRVHPAG
ncbi:hypothetical protein [Bradyrhizobium sacchari]|uniref:hypothetical protein n=1 Tax=Bradyrhizobium sacchari TaxID=1399419 RepID=UPI00137484AE|nr:hypothetical protein [Bradyrhizobium sacchari]